MIQISTTIVGSGILNLHALSGPIRVSFQSTQPQVQMIISNMHTAGDGTQIYICDTAGNEAIPVFGGTSITLETDSSFVVKNPTDEPMPVCVCRLIARGEGLVGPLKIERA